MYAETPMVETLYGITAMIRKQHPDTCFVVTQSNDNKIVFYKHTRLENKLVGTEGIQPFMTTLDKPAEYSPVSYLLQANFFGISHLQQIKRGRYLATSNAIPNRPIILSLTKDGNVHTLIDINEQSDITLFNIHLYITKNKLGYPTVHYADLHGYTLENNIPKFAHERVQITTDVKFFF